MATVLITGANRGIGLELVKEYAARGDVVIACCRDPRAATALAAVPGVVEVLALDVTDAASVEALAETLRGRPIDILVNNAGVLGPEYARQTAFEMDFEGWAHTFAVNTMGPVRVLHALLDNLRAGDRPRVVNITSQMGALSLDMTMGFGYSATKAGLNKYMRLAAIELGREGIHLCLIHPGWVRTEMGGAQADIAPAESARGIVATVEKLDASTNGSFWKWDGEPHDW